VQWLKSRVLSGEFHPIIAYLFTECKCYFDCHYCCLSWLLCCGAQTKMETASALLSVRAHGK
jgi:hypothetical protein